MINFKQVFFTVTAALVLAANCYAQEYKLEFLPEKSDAVLVHPIEKRGFVTVPLDYAHPTQQKLKIFYRLIPADGSSLSDDKDVIVVVNGGPGMPSKGYRAYDYDYAKKPDDNLKYLTKKYHVLIMDQRGTDGNSTALNMQASNLDYKAVAKLFSADSIARDQQLVINDAIGTSKPFYMIAQSFGGMVGFQYMWQPAIIRKPRAILLTSPAVPFEDVLRFAAERRNAQKTLNLELKKYEPNIANLVSELKAHFTQLGLNPLYTNILWINLGRGKDGVWQKKMIEEINSMMKMDKAGLEKNINETAGNVNLLNYILSSSNTTPGWTDSTLAKKMMRDIPYESWMLDEAALYAASPDGDTPEAKTIKRIDKNPPAAISFGTPAANKTTINSVPAMFTFADNDAMIPTDLAVKHMMATFYIDGKTKYAILKGGHQAIFLPDNVDFLSKWIGSL